MLNWLFGGRGLNGAVDDWCHRTAGLFHLRVRADSSIVDFADLELELVDLGLSGRQFEPREYADALERRLSIKIVFHSIENQSDPVALRRYAAEGKLAEARYLEQWNVVLISLPNTLPPFLVTLTAFHELAHVAAGDVIAGKRLARRPSLGDVGARESEADRRARHLYLAGSLGASNPCALELHGVP